MKSTTKFTVIYGIVLSGCCVVLNRPAPAAILNAQANVFGTHDVVGPSSAPSIVAQVDVPGGRGIGTAAEDFTVGAFGFSSSLGVATTAGGSGIVSTNYMILGNPLGIPLPLLFEIHLSGHMEIESIDPLWSAGATVSYGVSVNGIVLSSGLASLDIDFASRQFNLFGDFTPDQFDVSLPTNPQTADIDARIRTRVATVTMSGILGLNLGASAVGGSAIVTSDFLDGLTLESVSLPRHFHDPDVDVGNLMIKFDTGLVLPIQVDSSVVPESSAVAVWSLFCLIAVLYCLKREERLS